MSDLISRQDAIDAIMGEPTDAHYPSWYAQRIKLLPSAKPEIIACGEGELSAEPKTGEWVMLERVENVHDIYGVPTWGDNYMCDNCGFIHTAIQNHFSQYKYCPNCGARMCKGGEEE